jgi:hypothetical protein
MPVPGALPPGKSLTIADFNKNFEADTPVVAIRIPMRDALECRARNFPGWIQL